MSTPYRVNAVRDRADGSALYGAYAVQSAHDLSLHIAAVNCEYDTRVQVPK